VELLFFLVVLFWVWFCFWGFVFVWFGLRLLIFVFGFFFPVDYLLFALVLQFC